MGKYTFLQERNVRKSFMEETYMFLLTSKFCPEGVVCPAPATVANDYIHLLNHEKICIKSDVEEIFLNLQQMTKVMRPFY